MTGVKVTNPKRQIPPDKTYETTDELMIMALLMKGFKPCSIYPDDHRQLVWSFDEDEVGEFVGLALSGEIGEETFTYDAYFSAKATWKINLRHYIPRRDRSR